MKTFTFCLNVQVDARDEEEALRIAQHAKGLLQAFHKMKLHATFPYKVEIDINNIEEA